MFLAVCDFVGLQWAALCAAHVALCAAVSRVMELLHPRMADVYREKVGGLCLALESVETRTGAREAIRALIEAILLEPDGERLKITLKGDLAAECGQRHEEVARYRRPPGPNKAGCGGSQPTLSAALAPGGLRARLPYVPRFWELS